jgi:hypothetical protein
MENKGIFITPTTSGHGFSADKTYLVTAAHVVQPGNNTTVQTVEIITPGHIDILVHLNFYKPYRDAEASLVDSIIRASRTQCGVVKGGRIGVDRAGYREDWAVIELDPLYNGENCVWWEDPDHLSRFVGKESFQAGRLVGCKDPAADGTEWYQEGATDSWEGGENIQDRSGAVHERNH